MPSVSDNQKAKLVAILGGTAALGKLSISDLERLYYSTRSGLAANRSKSDHKLAFFKLKTAIGTPISLNDAETAYFKQRTAVGSGHSLSADYWARLNPET